MIQNFHCYLCGGASATQRPGHARDNSSLVPLECNQCGLVALSSFDHITDSFYSESHMHDSKPCDMELMRQQCKEDDARRFSQFSDLIKGKNVLDIGCGVGGFLAHAKQTANSVMGVEPEQRLYPFFEEQGLAVHTDLQSVPVSANPDVITMFHVLEHIPDPLSTLQEIHERFFSKKCTLIIEVPSASDALLTLYESEAFSKFTYWSCHLYLFTEQTLQTLAEKAGFSTARMIQHQRYPLANHLCWLAKGKPGGQQIYKISMLSG